MGYEKRTASGIYKKQNILFHKGFSSLGMVYAENKETWLTLFREVAGRDVSGLSDLSLGERHDVLAHLQGRGVRLFAPAVPALVREWRKGDPDVAYDFRVDADPQVRMVYAMWAEMGYEPKSLRGLVFRRFKKMDVRWLSDRELSQLVNLVKQRAVTKGVGNYYRRKSN